MNESEKKYEPSHPVKRLDMSQGYFDANGKRYYINLNLSVSRYKSYEPITLQAAFNRDLNGILNSMTKIINSLSGQDGYGMNLLKAQTDSLNEAINLRSSILNFFEQSNQHPSLLICSLVCNVSGEDERKWSMALANEKIQDWEEEGIAMEDFFLLALNLVPTLKSIYQEPWVKALALEKIENEEMNQE